MWHYILKHISFELMMEPTDEEIKQIKELEKNTINELDKIQQEELGSLLLESNKEVERLMNENIGVKQSTAQDITASRQRWEESKQHELSALSAQLSSAEVCLAIVRVLHAKIGTSRRRQLAN